MYPISQERLNWIEARRFILGRMINELTARQTRYQTPRAVPHHSSVMSSMIQEQLQLNIEANCIEEYLEDNKEQI
jgi:hypothetical protein